jgi:hypothetical protein
MPGGRSSYDPRPRPRPDWAAARRGVARGAPWEDGRDDSDCPDAEPALGRTPCCTLAVAGSKREGELRSSTHRAHAGRSEQGTYVEMAKRAGPARAR